MIEELPASMDLLWLTMQSKSDNKEWNETEFAPWRKYSQTNHSFNCAK